MPRKQETWYLRVGYHLTGQTYKSLTQALLTGRYYACATLDNLRVDTEVRGDKWVPVEVCIMKDGEIFTRDVI